MKDRCECQDPGCPFHVGESRCDLRATMTVTRFDYEPEGCSFRMCDECAEDAIGSGVFYDDAPDDRMGGAE